MASPAGPHGIPSSFPSQLTLYDCSLPCFMPVGFTALIPPQPFGDTQGFPWALPYLLQVFLFSGCIQYLPLSCQISLPQIYQGPTVSWRVCQRYPEGSTPDVGGRECTVHMRSKHQCSSRQPHTPETWGYGDSLRL